MTYQNRHECKFVVTETVARKVLQCVRPHVEPDPYAAAQPDHAYEIASLYLDDAQYGLYDETIDGRAERYKLRIRSYGGATLAADRIVFLEVKRRFNSIVRKLRCPVRHDRLEDLLNGTNLSPDERLAPQSARHRPAMSEFLRLVAYRSAGPRCTVRYRRQAYVGIDDLDTRVTFDRHLSMLPTQLAAIKHRHRGYLSVPAGGVILELKFTDRAPPWMSATIRKLELHRRSFSKYCTSIDAERRASNTNSREASA
jgi:hypothetical protein